MIVKNIDTHDIEIPFEGTTYKFPMGRVVQAPDSVANYIEENFPLSFSYGVTLQKEKAPEVEIYKTKVFLQNANINRDSDMQITNPKPTSTFNEDDGLDMNGSDWYGEGVAQDTLN